MFPNGGIIGPAAVSTSRSGAGVWNIREAVARMGAEPRQWPTPQDASFSSVVGLWHFQPVDEEIRDTGSGQDFFTNRGSSSSTLGLINYSAGVTAGRYDSAIKKWGTHSWKFVANILLMSPVSSDFQMSTGDFTIELWIYFTTLTSSPMVIDFRPASTNGAYPALYVTSAGSLRYYVNTADRITGANGNVTTGGWRHVILSRVSGSTYLGMDGAQQGSTWTDSTNYNGSNTRIWVGATGTNLAQLDGYVSEIRVTKGVGRYSGGSYTVPTCRFPDW